MFLDHEVADCGLSVLEYILMNHDDEEEKENTIKAYKIYKSMKENREVSDDMDMDDVYNKYAKMNKDEEPWMNHQMFMEMIDIVRMLLKNNILTGVCPIHFDSFFDHDGKVSECLHYYSKISS